MAAPRRVHLFLGVLVLLAALPLTGRMQNNPPAPAPGPSVEWRAFSGEEFSHYSPLDQINRDNVKNLQVAVDLAVRQLRHCH
jgi:glucose dehydrogenase